MRHLSEASVAGYVDAQLGAKDRARVEEHIAACGRCRARLEEVRARAERVSGALQALAPGPLEQPSGARALAAVLLSEDRRYSKPMFDRIRSSRRAQRTLAGVAAVIVLAGLLALPPVRALASQFLGLFRVEKFAVVDVDPERIREIAAAVDAEQVLGEPQVLAEGGKPTRVGSLAEAAAQAGFSPRAPEGYGEPAAIRVVGASSLRFTPDMAAVREVFAAVGLDPSLLPAEMDGQPFDLTIPAGVELSYDDGDPDVQRDFVVHQMPSPSADVPEGVDVQRLGQAMLQLLGMDPEEAARVSASIDWTSTLVLPIPTNAASVQEVPVDGTSGLLIEAAATEEGPRKDVVALLWQKDGIVNMIAGARGELDLVAIADALK